MRPRIEWTPELDDAIRAHRQARLTWATIAERMGLGRNTVLERGRKIGAQRGQRAPQEPPETRDRPSRPAGHPLTWGILNAGLATDLGAYALPTSPGPADGCRFPDDLGNDHAPVRFSCDALRLSGLSYCLCHGQRAYPNADFSHVPPAYPAAALQMAA